MDRRGLKIVWVGMLLSLIGSFVSSYSSGDNVGSFVTEAGQSAAGTILSAGSGVVSLVAFILTIVGLSQLKGESAYFKRARNLLIATLIATIVVVVVLAVVIIGAAVAGAPEESFLLIPALCIVVLIALLLVFSILYYRNFLKGCQYVSKRCGESLLAEKFMKMWRRFVVAVILVAAGGVALIGGIIYLAGSNPNGLAGIVPESGNVEDLVSLAALLPGIVLMIIGGVMLFIFTILLLVRVGILAFGNRTEQPPQDGDDLYYV